MHVFELYYDFWLKRLITYLLIKATLFISYFVSSSISIMFN